MPCPEKHLEKLDAMLDSAFNSSKKDDLEDPKDDCKDSKDKKNDTQLDPGLLGKKNAS
jgi:hypothetical protein